MGLGTVRGRAVPDGTRNRSRRAERDAALPEAVDPGD
jgi:hypothetical protein